MRLRITFAKTREMRYTSHLDLYRTWERTLRRAKLPLAYSQGYNPHPKINLASALPLGFTSQNEVMDVWLDEDLPSKQVEQALQAAAPPGLVIQQVEPVDERLPTLQTVLEASDYSITFLEPVERLDERVKALLAAEELPRERRGKPYDLRPLILELRCMPDDEQGNQRLFARLRAQEGATGRPEEVIDAIGALVEATRVHRTGLVFSHP